MLEITCNLCPEKFPSSIHFRRHSIDVHRKSNNTLVKKNKEPFCCDECGKTFKVTSLFNMGNILHSCLLSILVYLALFKDLCKNGRNTQNFKNLTNLEFSFNNILQKNAYCFLPILDCKFFPHKKYEESPCRKVFPVISM